MQDAGRASGRVAPDHAARRDRRDARRRPPRRAPRAREQRVVVVGPERDPPARRGALEVVGGRPSAERVRVPPAPSIQASPSPALPAPAPAAARTRRPARRSTRTRRGRRATARARRRPGAGGRRSAPGSPPRRARARGGASRDRPGLDVVDARPRRPPGPLESRSPRPTRAHPPRRASRSCRPPPGRRSRSSRVHGFRWRVVRRRRIATRSVPVGGIGATAEPSSSSADSPARQPACSTPAVTATATGIERLRGTPCRPRGARSPRIGPRRTIDRTPARVTIEADADQDRRRPDDVRQRARR